MQTAVDTGLFVSLFTAQSPSGNFGPSGQPDGVYNDVAGLILIPCTAPPTSEIRIQATELKTLEEIMSSELKHVLLSAWYPQMESGAAVGWRAVIDGTVYDVLGAESDSQDQMTRVQVRLATV